MTLAEKLKDDRGSLTAAMVIWTPILIILASFVVDLGTLLSNRDKADNIAEQVARRVADDLAAGPLRENPPRLVVNVSGAVPPGDCTADANDFITTYLKETGDQVTFKSCTVTGNSVGPAVPPAVASIPVVTVQITMASKSFIGAFGKAIPDTVTGTGTASPVGG